MLRLTFLNECPHCHNVHYNSIEQALCPLRPEQVPVNIEMFGQQATNTKYRITDHVHFLAEGQQLAGVILWTIAPGQAGTHVEASDLARYVIECDRKSDECYAVPEKDILEYA